VKKSWRWKGRMIKLVEKAAIIKKYYEGKK
jgi:hypothetical protein